jgi:ActR/RegA family two-component response regulator
MYVYRNPMVIIENNPYSSSPSPPHHHSHQETNRLRSAPNSASNNDDNNVDCDGNDNGSIKGPVVLLLDDNKDVCSLLIGVLSLKGIECIKAFSVEECIEKISNSKMTIKVAVVNGRLAMEKGGYLISRLRDLSLKMSILVIANKDSDRARILRLGCDEFAKKPISAESVADKVIALLLVGNNNNNNNDGALH